MNKAYLFLIQSELFCLPVYRNVTEGYINPHIFLKQAADFSAMILTHIEAFCATFL